MRPTITCCVCGAVGHYSDIHKDGWRLAANLPGFYVCSADCDKRVMTKAGEFKV